MIGLPVGDTNVEQQRALVSPPVGDQPRYFGRVRGQDAQPAEPRIAAPDGAGEGAGEHESERSPSCVSERAEPATHARAVPSRANVTATPPRSCGEESNL